jgi:hypothetical protein
MNIDGASKSFERTEEIKKALSGEVWEEELPGSPLFLVLR